MDIHQRIRTIRKICGTNKIYLLFVGVLSSIVLEEVALFGGEGVVGPGGDEGVGKVLVGGVACALVEEGQQLGVPT